MEIKSTEEGQEFSIRPHDIDHVVVTATNGNETIVPIGSLNLPAPETHPHDVVENRLPSKSRFVSSILARLMK